MTETKLWDEIPLADYGPADLRAALQELFSRIAKVTLDEACVLVRPSDHELKVVIAVGNTVSLLNAFVLWQTDDKCRDRNPENFKLAYEYLDRAEKLRKRTRTERKKKGPLVPSQFCQARVHLGGSNFKVYDFAMATSRKNKGECWLSWRTTAKWCGLNKETAGLAIAWLVDYGWLEQLTAPAFGRDGKGKYRVVEHDEWVKARKADGCVMVPLAYARQTEGYEDEEGTNGISGQ